MESYPLEALLLPSPSFQDVVEGSESPLMEKKIHPIPSAKLAWLSDAADLFALLCSVLLIATSIALVAIIFCIQTFGAQIPEKVLLYTQRVISTLSLTITSAVIMVAGKRYVLYKFARGGLRSQRVAIYSNPTAGNLASYLVSHGAELPLLGLSAVLGLALVTGLTVNDSWEMGSMSSTGVIPTLSGPLDLSTSDSSWVFRAVGQLSFVMSSWCLGLADTIGLVRITSANIDPSHPMGTIYYPPVGPLNMMDTNYSFVTTYMMNGFNVSFEPLSSVPSTALNIQSACAQNIFYPSEIWYDGSDNQTLSIVVVDESDGVNSTFRINATAIVMGGVLSYNGTYAEFVLNGTSWPNVMSTGNRWAEDILNVACNTTVTAYGACSGTLWSLSDFAALLNQPAYGSCNSEKCYYPHWNSVLSMALGAYSFGMFSSVAQAATEVVPYPDMSIPVTMQGVRFTSNYGTYILIVNIVVSIIMLIIVVRLRLASHLESDFINSTRLLLDPLKKPELFNASLQTTVDAFENPYMMVEADDTFMVSQQTRNRERNWFGMSVLRKRRRSVGLGDDST